MRNQATDNRVEARERAGVFARERGTRPTYDDPGRVASMLGGAEQNKAKAADTPATIAAGTPIIAPASGMREQGLTGDFAKAMEEYPGFAPDFMARLEEFDARQFGREQRRDRSSIA